MRRVVLILVLVAGTVFPGTRLLRRRAPAAAAGGGGITHVSTASVNKTTNGTSQAITLSGVTAGNQIVAGGWIHDTTGATCSDDKSSTYTSVILGGNLGGATAFECHTLSAGGSGTVNVTVSYTNSTYGIFFASEFSGITSADTNAQGSTFSPPGTSWTWPSITTSASGITLGYAGNGNSNSTHTATNSYIIPTNGDVSGGAQNGVLLYKLTSSGSNAPTATFGTSLEGTVLTFSFK